jgi:hypothetical protein
MQPVFSVAWLAVPLAACGTAGALRAVNLVGQCAANDEACARRHPVAPIAVGAKFHPEVSTGVAGTTTPNLHLLSSLPDVLAVEDGALVAKQPGASAVLISTDDGSVVDFVHMWAAPVTRITLTKRDGDRIGAAIGLTVGEDLTLQPALWNGPQRLMGEGQVTWTSSNEGALALLRDGSTDRRRLRARAPGKTTITVALGAATTSVEIEVVP